MLVATDPGVTEINCNGGCNQWVNYETRYWCVAGVIEYVVTCRIVCIIFSCCSTAHVIIL